MTLTALDPVCIHRSQIMAQARCTKGTVNLTAGGRAETARRVSGIMQPWPLP